MGLLQIIILMNYSNGTKKNKIKLSSLNQDIEINEVFVKNSILYCDTCGKNIQKKPILCYIFIDYFCSKKCHIQKHKINQKI